MFSSSSSRLAVVLGAVTGLSLAACSVKSSRAGPGSGTPGGSNDTGTPTALSCGEVVDCVNACPENDQACVDACVERGDATAKSKLNDVQGCIQRNGCTDENCIATSCKTEVEACLAHRLSSNVGGGGNVPESLVGQWIHSGGGARIEYTFAGDGSYHEISGLSSGGSCPTTSSWSIDGTVVFEADTVTFDEVSGTRVTNTCSTNNPAVPIVPESETKSWVLEGGTLYLWKPAECQDYRSCGIDFTKP